MLTLSTMCAPPTRQLRSAVDNRGGTPPAGGAEARPPATAETISGNVQPFIGVTGGVVSAASTVFTRVAVTLVPEPESLA